MIYTTTFRGVRSTFEDCKYVLSVFHNSRVQVDERDVYMNSFYYNELEERLGERLQGEGMSVPHVFINGQYVGVCCNSTPHTHPVIHRPGLQNDLTKMLQHSGSDTM